MTKETLWLFVAVVLAGAMLILIVTSSSPGVEDNWWMVEKYYESMFSAARVDYKTLYDAYVEAVGEEPWPRPGYLLLDYESAAQRGTAMHLTNVELLVQKVIDSAYVSRR